MSSTTSSLSATATAGGNRAPSQGGVIDGSNPTTYDPKNPLIVFIIQAGIILIVCHALHWPLSKIRQPRVIAEVVGGIVLGPSVMGHIPGFTEAIFPTESIPNLTLAANIGLVLYLFIIGLETDVRFLISNWRIASSVAFAGLALPFGLGCGLAWGLYNQFSDDPGIVHTQFSTYMLFIGVAIAITAFPVLCRILTELKLLDTTAGIVTLSAGVANDVIGWILLALCVALVNASDGILALYILLTAAGWLLFLLFVVRPCLLWLLHRTGNIQNGPSQSMMTLILLIALTSGFFTGIIGIHPIFGGFMAGLIIPRENSFTIRVTEKLEDLIGALFLPLYFTLSGLSTNLGLLDNGITWGYVFAVTFTAFFSKIIGASIAARLNSLVWRESFAIGALMSCKGLVELIALNIGLQARILSTRTFTIFVVMALITTFATTPIVSALYPPWYQKKLSAWKRGEIDWDTGEPISGTSDAAGDVSAIPAKSERINSLLVYLRLDNMPSILNLVSLFGATSLAESDEKSKAGKPRAVRAHGLHLIELTDRDSSVMTVSEVDDFTRRDPVVNIFRTVGQFLKVGVSGEVAIMPESRFADALMAKSIDLSSDLVLVPWTQTGNFSDADSLVSGRRYASSYIGFVKSVLRSPSATTNVGIFFPQERHSRPASSSTSGMERNKLTRAYSFSDIHRNIELIPATNKSHHIFMPFVGGPDDRFALTLVLQLCEKHEATATIAHVSLVKSPALDKSFIEEVSSHIPASVSPRVQFKTAVVENLNDNVLREAESDMKSDAGGITWHNLVVLGRKNPLQDDGGRMARSSDGLQECLGITATVLVGSAIKSDLLIVQAKEHKS